MKYLLFLSTILFYSPENEAFAQSYQASNKIVAVVKETKTNLSHLYSSRGLSVKTDLERNEFNFQVALNGFVEVDTLQNLRLDVLLPAIDFPMLSFKGQLPFNKLDKGLGNKQTLDVQGVFSFGNQNVTTSIPIEFEFMDKQLLFDTFFTIDLAKFNATFPKEYQEKLSNRIEFRIDNGHLLVR